MNLYVTTAGMKVGTTGGKIEIRQNDEKIADYPMNLVDCLTLYTGVNVTQAVIREFAENRKNIFWINSLGRTYACIFSPGSENIQRRKNQFLLTDDVEFRLKMAKKFISAKLQNQSSVIKKYCSPSNSEMPISEIDRLIDDKLPNASVVEEIMGIEGLGAKLYFEALSTIIPDEYGFYRRTKQPPKDCFSALLSFGYTLLHNDFVTAIQGAGLDPNVGIMHKLHNDHYALASDMMEEFRAPIVDSVSIDLIHKRIISPDDFEYSNNGAVYLGNRSSKKFIAVYEDKLKQSSGIKKKKGVGIDWKSLISVQVYELVNAVDRFDPARYAPILAA